MKKKHSLFILAIIFLTIVVPIVFLLIVKRMMPSDITVDRIIHFDNIIGLGVQYYSILLTTILSIFVFLQNEKINNLERSEYDYYLGTKEIDNSFVLGKRFLNNTSNDLDSNEYFGFDQSIYDNKLIQITSLNLSKEKSNDSHLIAFNLISKNKLLILGLDFKKIEVELISSNSETIRKTFTGKDALISECIENNSIIPIAFGIIVPKMKGDINRINLVITLKIVNQHNENRYIKIYNSVLCDERSYYLLSTKTEQVKNNKVD